MVVPGTGECHHCKKLGHWRDNCPLLQLPDGKADHEERIADFTRRFTEQEIGPIAKRKMIDTEKQLWKKKQREMARQ
jgi:hypothetical protein